MDIKAIRNELKLTQEELAVNIGCSVSSVKFWETNRCKPSLRMQKKIEELRKKQIQYMQFQEAGQIGEVVKSIHTTVEFMKKIGITTLAELLRYDYDLKNKED